MRRMKVIMLRVLLAWLLLLAASGRQFPAFVKAQATVHTNSKLQPGQHQIYVHSGNIRSTKGTEKKICKPPSGPNPTGNHRPPSKH